MATLHKIKRKGGKVVYQVDYYYMGKRCRKSTKTGDKKAAELILKDIEVKIAKGEFGFEVVKKSNLRLKLFIEKYLEFSKSRKAANTFYLDRHSLTGLEEFLGNVLLREISNKNIEEYIQHRLETVKPSSVNVEIRHLKTAFNQAVNWKAIKANPMKDVKQLKIKESDIPKFFTEEEISKLFSVITDEQFKNLIRFYLYTGCRRSEVLNITWDDVDFKNKKILIRVTKSGKYRKIPINSQLMQILKSMNQDTEKLFHYQCPDSVNRRFKRYLNKAEIKNWKELSIHNLRHTFASHLVMKGTGILHIQKLLGHSRVSVTEMYAHLLPDQLEAAVERLEY